VLQTGYVPLSIHSTVAPLTVTAWMFCPLHPDATISDAVNLFNTHKISCIHVVDNEFRPLGIVSWRDILKAVAASACKKPGSEGY
jgi:CBS domain-containing protein